MTFEISKGTPPSKGPRGSLQNIPFGNLIEPNSFFTVAGSVSGVTNNLNNFVGNMVNTKDPKDPNFKALRTCYQVSKRPDVGDKADGVDVWLLDYRPDIPASEVARRLAEATAEAEEAEEAEVEVKAES